jgi:Cu/Ag efflux protein CusF
MKQLIVAAVLASACWPIAAPAIDAHHARQGAPSAASGPMTDGEVREVDKKARKITLRHGPISNLDMPAMSMVFQVKDSALLAQVKAGDKVRFLAEKANGAFVVTHIEPAR